MKFCHALLPFGILPHEVLDLDLEAFLLDVDILTADPEEKERQAAVEWLRQLYERRLKSNANQ